MKSLNNILSIIIYILTVVDIAIVIFDTVTKGSTSTGMMLATVACICVSAADIYLRVHHKE